MMMIIIVIIVIIFIVDILRLVRLNKTLDLHIVYNRKKAFCFLYSILNFLMDPPYLEK
jgi:hypothetical protein